MRSSRPFPLFGESIVVQDHRFLQGLGYVPLIPKLAVQASAVPHYWALLYYTRLQRMLGKHASDIPTLEQFESVGGFSPMSFLDVMAGGTGDGQRWTWIEYRRHALIDFELISSPCYEAPPSVSCAPFPVQGSRVDDGTGVEAGFIPEWMAALLHRRYLRFNDLSAPTLDQLRAAGGMTPVRCLDLFIGGRGDGLAHRMVEKKWTDEKQLTELESGLLKDAAPVPSAIKVV